MGVNMNEGSLQGSLPNSLKTFQGFEPFQIFVNRNEGDWRMPFEWHEPLEIFYVKSGRGQFYIDDKVYVFEPDDLFVIGNRELHKSQLIDHEPFEVLVIMFDPELAKAVQVEDGMDPLSLFYERDVGFSHCLKVREPLRSKLSFAFERLQEEHEGGTDSYSRRTIVSHLQWLLVELNRAYRGNTPYIRLDNHSKVHFKPVVAGAMEFINEHYNEDLHLDRIAGYLGVNPSYLSRVFKQNSGFSLVEFITFKRVWRAKEMLLYTNRKVTDIAYEIGYNNVTHFQWTFKKMFGVSPSQYRKLPRGYYRLQKY
ncbi:helix-turn-helix transcriptional regulator [Paenibacillus beijingensis]|uniref:helix-turn-helix transcriptional regulator n=1 Tax=Paenibacillus beijingensis TaxID=1126833 RepID=UPI000698BC4B|nr:AraC family transcriptional regulator [Paenibacillus beijingensis]